MAKTHPKQTPNKLRKILFVLVGILSLFLLMYGFIAAASLTGRETIRVDGLDRKYRVYVPSSYRETESMPLVLALHMLTGSGRTMQWITHFNAIAEQQGFIVVYPDGYKASWAEGSNLYAADQAHIDDAAFIDELINSIEDQYAINRNQIFATGFSSGGLMVQRLGCEMADRFSAIAIVGATLPQNVFEDCSPQEPLPVLMIHGSDDHGVPWNGNLEYTSVPATIEFWATHNECNSKPAKEQELDLVGDGTHIERDTYVDCQENATVVLYSIIGGGHTWPGGNKPAQLWGLNGKISANMDASTVIWEFFEQTSR